VEIARSIRGLDRRAVGKDQIAAVVGFAADDELAIVGMVVFAEDCCDSPSAPFAMVQLGCWDVGGASSR